MEVHWPKCADCGADASPEFHGALQVPDGVPGFFLYFCRAHRQPVDDAMECERLASMALRESQLAILSGGSPPPEKPKRKGKVKRGR